MILHLWTGGIRFILSFFSHILKKPWELILSFLAVNGEFYMKHMVYETFDYFYDIAGHYIEK